MQIAKSISKQASGTTPPQVRYAVGMHPVMLRYMPRYMPPGCPLVTLVCNPRNESGLNPPTQTDRAKQIRQTCPERKSLERLDRQREPQFGKLRTLIWWMCHSPCMAASTLVRPLESLFQNSDTTRNPLSHSVNSRPYFFWALHRLDCTVEVSVQ